MDCMAWHDMAPQVRAWADATCKRARKEPSLPGAHFAVTNRAAVTHFISLGCMAVCVGLAELRLLLKDILPLIRFPTIPLADIARTVSTR